MDLRNPRRGSPKYSVELLLFVTQAVSVLIVGDDASSGAVPPGAVVVARLVTSVATCGAVVGMAGAVLPYTCAVVDVCVVNVAVVRHMAPFASLL